MCKGKGVEKLGLELNFSGDRCQFCQQLRLPLLQGAVSKKDTSSEEKYKH